MNVTADSDNRTDLHPALRGPWVATLTDYAGFPADIDQQAEADGLQVSVLRGTAAPTQPSQRLPGSYRSDDVLYRIDDFLDEEDAADRWEQAKAVAEAMNRLAEGGGSR